MKFNSTTYLGLGAIATAIGGLLAMIGNGAFDGEAFSAIMAGIITGIGLIRAKPDSAPDKTLVIQDRRVNDDETILEERRVAQPEKGDS